MRPARAKRRAPTMPPPPDPTTTTSVSKSHDSGGSTRRYGRRFLLRTPGAPAPRDRFRARLRIRRKHLCPRIPPKRCPKPSLCPADAIPLMKFLLLNAAFPCSSSLGPSSFIFALLAWMMQRLRALRSIVRRPEGCFGLRKTRAGIELASNGRIFNPLGRFFFVGRALVPSPRLFFVLIGRDAFLQRVSNTSVEPPSKRTDTCLKGLRTRTHAASFPSYGAPEGRLAARQAAFVRRPAGVCANRC